MSVGAEGEARRVGETQHVGYSGASVGNHLPEDVVPLVVDHLGCIEPGALMRLERDIGPGVMGMRREVEAIRLCPEESGEVRLEVHPSYLNRIDSTMPAGSGGRSALGMRNVDRL